ncbi:Rv1733c family protein [Nonomuraea jabiensis]|uniref:Rv1733c family protein n=1 Tax=Nonomuraea jabiensis TaxID=882448 RepID=UPI0036CD84D4
MALRMRRYWLGRNPLRRRSDRLEGAGVAVALILLLFSVWPAVVMGRLAYENGLQAERAGPGIRQQVTATLVQDAPGPVPVAGEGVAPESHAAARWVTPSGERRTGQVAVPAGARTGASVKAWIDGRGALTRPPTTHADTLAGAVTTTLLVIAGAAATLALGFRGFRWLLDRGRYAAWDASWAEACARWRRRKPDR